MSEHTPTPWTYSDVSGAGLEIRAPVFLSKGVELPRGMPDAPIKIFEFTAPQIVQVAAERWVQFEPEGWSAIQEANAAFIVKAVNNHEALVGALYDALAYIDLHQEVCQFDPPEITAARDVLYSCDVGSPVLTHEKGPGQ